MILLPSFIISVDITTVIIYNIVEERSTILLYIFNEYVLEEVSMNSFIKKFIENYINIIEANEWEHVFLNWYNLSVEIWPDLEIFNEFIKLLVNAGIEPDMNARRAVLYDQIQWIFQHWTNSKTFEDNRHIGCASIGDALNSHLGYNYPELTEIIADVAKSFKNLRYTDYYGGGYTW